MHKNSINVMTWNINRFRGSGLNGKENIYCEQDCDGNPFNKIVSITKDFIDNDNAIVFLNEVPYKTKSNKSNEWSTVEYYNKLNCEFPDTDYVKIFNEKYNNGYLTHCTLAITKKGRLEECSCSYPLNNNRAIAARINGVTLLGVHMPTVSNEASDKDKNEVEEIWCKLICYTQEKTKNNEKLIILGDFNAYVDCKNKITKEKFQELLKYTTDISPQDKKTFRDLTLIDHVLINCKIDESSCAIEVEDKLDYSDHKYIKLLWQQKSISQNKLYTLSKKRRMTYI